MFLIKNLCNSRKEWNMKIQKNSDETYIMCILGKDATSNKT